MWMLKCSRSSVQTSTDSQPAPPATDEKAAMSYLWEFSVRMVSPERNGKRSPATFDLLAAPADQMHLDAALPFVPPRLVRERFEIEIRAEFAIDDAGALLTLDTKM